VVFAAATLTVGAAQAEPTAHAPTPVADVHQLAPAGPATPFDATPYVTPLDPPVSSVVPVKRHPTRPAATAPGATLPVHLDVTASAIPRRVLAAYVNATNLADRTDPTCKLQWQTLAGIGFIESGHARSGGSENPKWDGEANPPILGPVLDGSAGFGSVPDTDHGLLDGNPTWDRAVGPMQFIPSTWETYAADGNHDGIRDPENIDDATLAAADYLCATGADLNRPQNRIRAIYAYNHSYTYVADVLTVAAGYLDINPAKLGINGLPKDHKHKHKHRKLVLHITAPPSTVATASPSPSASPSSPGPTVTPTAAPTSTPAPTVPTTPPGSASPRPTKSPLGGHLPHH
jgi:membrane-bound lytic murein transglycosylase B